jgi:hypothetical protein
MGQPSIKIGTAAYVWMGQHGTYLRGRVVSVRNNMAVVVCNGQTFTIPTSRLILEMPKGYA